MTNGTPADNRNARLVDAIRSYLRQGWSLIPIRSGDKRPPLKWEEYAQTKATAAQWNEWWGKWPGCSVAVVYGTSAAPAGKQLVCVDTDTPEAEAWVSAHDEQPLTPTVVTAKGRHRYYYAPADLLHVASVDDKPEVRAGAHYGLVPPSLHPSGIEYTWAPGLAFGEVAVSDAPAWAVGLMGKPEAERDWPAGEQAPAEERFLEGGRNDGLFRLCAKWRANGLTDTPLRIAAEDANQRLCSPPLDARELNRIVQSVCRYAVGTPAREQWQARRRDAQAQPHEENQPPAAEDLQEAYLPQVVQAVNETAALPKLKTQRLADVAGEIIETFETNRLMPREVRGLRSGFRSMDNHFLGFSRQQLILLHGPSGYGKTHFANHCIFATALAEQASGREELTLVILCECTKDQLMSSYLGYRWGLPKEVREAGSERFITDDQMRLLVDGYSEFPTLPIAVHDDVIDLMDIEALIRRYWEEYPMAGVVIDHAQEIEVPRCRSRHEEVSLIAQRLRNLSEKIQVPIMLLSQTTEKDGNYDPEYSKGLRQKCSLEFVVTRGKPGCTREVAVQSNVTRILTLKSRWGHSPVAGPLTLYGDYRTGRLWEEAEYEALQGLQNQEEAIWHDN